MDRLEGVLKLCVCTAHFHKRISLMYAVYAVGVTEEDMNKPQIGICPIWWEGNPCNSHLLDLARDVKEGCKSEDLVGLTFNTIGTHRHVLF